MAFELLNTGMATPHRLRSLLQVARLLDSPTRERIVNLVEPPLANKHGSDADTPGPTVYRSAVTLGLLLETAEGMVEPQVSAADLSTAAAFRMFMQGVVLGQTEENQPNHLFSLYTAWYAGQNDEVFRKDSTGLYVDFNETVGRGSDDRVFNQQKQSGWSRWAQFLGFGYPLRSNSSVLVPDALVRLRTVVPALLYSAEPVPFRAFISALPPGPGGMSLCFFGLTALFRVYPGICAGRIDETKQWTFKLLSNLHYPEGLAVALRLRHAEIVPDAALGIGTLLVADHDDGAVLEAADPAHDGGVLGEVAVARKRREVRDQRVHIVEAMRPIGMPRHLGLLPRRELGVGVDQRLLRLVLELRHLFGDGRGTIVAVDRPELGDLAFELGDRLFEIVIGADG